MQYRPFGKLDWKGSALGFGAMRLPTLDDDSGEVDEAEAIRILRYAIDHGVNYVDTAYGYHRGKSEVIVGKALENGYRQRIRLATKLPCWLVNTADDFDRLLNEQLGRLQTDKIDFYLLHALSAESWHKVRDLGVLQWAEKQMAAGRVGRLGFSFHDNYAAFQEIVDAYDNWTFCQIQYNYMDEENQAGTKGLQYAASKGLALVIMEPLRGGLLAGEPPQPVRNLWNTATRSRTPGDWALQWLWNRPEVAVVLSGMSTMEQVVQNIDSAGRSSVGLLTAEDLALVGRVRDAYQALAPIPCTDCKYCQPCPNGVNIPRIFALYNEAMMYNTPQQARIAYERWMKAEERADKCLECGECESACPQGIAIIDWLKKTDQFLVAAA